MKGKIHSIETFGSVDGPGIRFVVFLKGCPLRCLYCHNPDTWLQDGANEMEAEEILEKALRYKEYWGEEGGITVSGGEPLMQIDFLIDFFKRCKEAGVNTCIDTSGAPYVEDGPWHERFLLLMSYTDLLLVDIKHIDGQKHRALTGKGNENILAMLRFLDMIHKPVWIRHVLVPGFTDDDGDLERTRDFIASLSNVEKVEVLPFHKLGEWKYAKLGYPYRLSSINPPTSVSVLHASETLSSALKR